MSANTPRGATLSTQPTITSMVCAIERSSSTSGARCAAGRRVSAKPTMSAKSTSGTIASPAAAAIAFDGSRFASCSASPGTAGADAPSTGSRASGLTGPPGHSEYTAGAASAVAAATATSNATKSPSARLVARPAAAALLASATPTMTRETTRGTTVIRSALSHSAPTGDAIAASCAAKSSPASVDRTPTRIPSASPISTRTVVDKRGLPPLLRVSSQPAAVYRRLVAGQGDYSEIVNGEYRLFPFMHQIESRSLASFGWFGLGRRTDHVQAQPQWRVSGPHARRAHARDDRRHGFSRLCAAQLAGVSLRGYSGGACRRLPNATAPDSASPARCC